MLSCKRVNKLGFKHHHHHQQQLLLLLHRNQHMLRHQHRRHQHLQRFSLLNPCLGRPLCKFLGILQTQPGDLFLTTLACCGIIAWGALFCFYGTACSSGEAKVFCSGQLRIQTLRSQLVSPLMILLLLLLPPLLLLSMK